MLSKLIESWLDNASERSYQPAFCQMLISQGYTVIHSTRHCPIEYGKDVLAISKDGTPCAFQLKGNPSGSLTLSQFREIRPQLDELVNQHIAHPSISKDLPHRSYLVTNGRIEEEVSLAISQSNEKNIIDGYPQRKLETIAREQLLGWALELESDLWPSELTELRTLLEILTYRGDELFPVEKLHKLLIALFKMAPAEAGKIGDPEFSRRLSSSALLTAVALKPFSERANYFAVASAWAVFSVYAIGLAAKYKKRAELVTPSLNLAEEAIRDGLGMLLHEAYLRNGIYREGNGLADFPVYAWRYTLLVGLASLYWLESERTGLWKLDQKAEVESILPDDQTRMSLWGEGAIPQFLLHNWYRQQQNAGTEDSQVISLAKEVMSKPLFCAYYSAEEVIRHELSKTFEAFNSTIAQTLGNKASVSYFSATLMAHLAQRGLKEACQDLWRRYSKMTSLAFLPKEPWMFCLWHSEEGDNHSFNPPETGRWADLVATSQIDIQTSIPQLLAERPLLLALWSLLAPYRATTPAICHLYNSFSVEKSVGDAAPTAEAA